ncbi:MAG TPA: hypothetical protein VNX28_19910 [Gemmataceae bacterium]|jgi:hypothetical protein|nr:hypothetical protein [Gemmataceae bacterium]
MKRSILCLGAFALITVGAGRTYAGVLYSQPSDNIGFFYSQNDTGGATTPANGTTYDNFTLGTTSTVRNVSWVGGFLPTIVNNTITSFTLTFYSDNSGAPGTALTTNTISGNANQSFVGRDALQDYVYSYSANLPTPFVATSGTHYWLSVVANLNAGGTFQWGWENSGGASDPGDGVGYQSLLGAMPTPITSDSAFTLSDVAAVPEPSTLVMASALFGIFGGVLTYKRRQRNALAA